MERCRKLRTCGLEEVLLDVIQRIGVSRYREPPSFRHLLVWQLTPDNVVCIAPGKNKPADLLATFECSGGFDAEGAGYLNEPSEACSHIVGGLIPLQDLGPKFVVAVIAALKASVRPSGLIFLKLARAFSTMLQDVVYPLRRFAKSQSHID